MGLPPGGTRISLATKLLMPRLWSFQTVCGSIGEVRRNGHVPNADAVAGNKLARHRIKCDAADRHISGIG